MKKMLAKAVALSLVLGGVGFVANNAQAAAISDGVKVFSGTNVGWGHDVKTETALEKDTALANQKDLVKVNEEVATNKANIAKNAGNISDNAIAIDKEIAAREGAISEVKDDIAANADAIKANKAEADEQHKYLNSRIENNTANIDKNKVAIENEVKAREDADNKLNTKIDAETDARKDADNKLRADLNQETIDRVDADNRLQTAIDQKADKTTVAENTAAIESNKAAIAQEKKDREHADQKLQDQITINKGQIENEATNRANEDKRIEAKFDGEVSRLDGRIDQLDANVEKVGAMAAAIANLHTMGYDPEAPTEIAVGVGQYRDKTGLALGAFHYPNRDFMLSFSVSTAGDEFMGGIGATWKFGRKSPEELRQAEAEKAAKAKLAKAEAAKKAAKDARVAAQQKRHAEMLAARTGK